MRAHPDGRLVTQERCPARDPRSVDHGVQARRLSHRPVQRAAYAHPSARRGGRAAGARQGHAGVRDLGGQAHQCVDPRRTWQAAPRHRVPGPLSRAHPEEPTPGPELSRRTCSTTGATTARIAGRSRVHWKLDPFSSAITFEGWKEREAEGGRFVQPPTFVAPLVWEPSTWLLKVGWRRYGLLSAFEVPGRGVE